MKLKNLNKELEKIGAVFKIKKVTVTHPDFKPVPVSRENNNLVFHTNESGFIDLLKGHNVKGIQRQRRKKEAKKPVV